jgi:hypothetical protein
MDMLTDQTLSKGLSSRCSFSGCVVILYVTLSEKSRLKSPGKILRKKGKVKEFFSKDAPLIHLIHPKVQKYIQKCLKIAPMSLKLIVFQYNDFAQTSKISKNHCFPSVKRPTFQNVTKYL